MVGLFDSGSGGLNTVRYIKKYSPTIDLVYKIDRKNAPYGIKSKEEIINITEDNIKELTERGAEYVLIACCTASSVHGELKEEYRKLSIPIISPVSSEALSVSEKRRIAVIGTERTVRSHVFGNELGGFCVGEFATQDLVDMIDNGLNDSTINEEAFLCLSHLLAPLKTAEADTLILGCTHFPSLINSIGEIASNYGIKHIIDSAKVGARTLMRHEMDR